ncbi:MAG: MG2 domain-containing protein [Verrucomicrobiales bacterium]
MKFVPLLVITLCSLLAIPSGKTGPAEDARNKAAKLKKAGNWKESFEAYKGLLINEGNSGKTAAEDLQNAWDSLNRLGQVVLMDEFLESVIQKYPQDWRVLSRAGSLYMRANSWGFIIGGEFKRGHHRGGGKRVNTQQRDRVRALSLMEQAMKAAGDDEDKAAVAGLYLEFANAIGSNRGRSESWRLQYLTDFSKLPDWDEGGYHGARDVGAPVDDDGKPILYSIPESWEKATDDGERWRYLLTEAAELAPTRAGEIMFRWSSFLRNQFGVERMRQWGFGGFFGGHSPDDGRENESGTYELHTLKQNETIARLATGIKRISLPDEHNHIFILKQIAALPDKSSAERATNDLAGIFENRRQYPLAAKYWQESIRKFGPGNNNRKVKSLDQILDNWGRFDGSQSHAAGKKPVLGFVFRNGERVDLSAYSIDVPTLLDDVKGYLKSNPLKIDNHRMNIGNIGYELVNEKWKKYVGKKVAEWDLRLEPRKNHWDRRIDIVAPMKKPGAYLLRARMKDGNTSHIVVWIADTAIVRKPLDQKSYYFVADARSGKPVAKANLEFFGYRYEYLRQKKGLQGILPQRRFNVITKQFAEFTDADGQVILDQEQMPRQMQWLIIARSDDGRFAYHGFNGVWYSQRHDAQYKATKTLVVTDRPVYRPGQDVEFKAWVRHSQYDKEDESQFAGKSFSVRINNPKGEKIYEKNLTADEFGGLADKITLPDGATLGSYRIHLLNTGQHGGNTFRVEEYKKPEFEVSIEAPSEPVMLGEKIKAKVRANYLFGAPVQNATVKYKVMRSEHDSRWFAPMPWDWFYGSGYWWFGYDYNWYPGWRNWGCRAPVHWWWPRGNMPPEIVLENEVKIGEDGTAEIEIDTALAKAMHGDIDHSYSITAEVRDASRRTIVGQGKVLVARSPFKVNTWLDRGYYRVGEVISANACARTLDGKPVAGKGTLKLLKVSYDEDGKPVEEAVKSWKVDPDAEGCINQQIKASASGQYRLSYKLKDKAGHEIEGGYVFVVRGEGFNGKKFRFNDIEIITDKREYAAGETIELMINTAREDGTVALFLRPSNGVYLPPKIIRLEGKSTVTEVTVTKKDMPNFFIEAFTVSGGKIYEQTREVIVPPEKRVLNVEVLPSEKRYKPGQAATVKVKLTDFDGKPFVGSTVVTVYDKALEYISGGSNVPEIREFFWKWRRNHNRNTQFSLSRWFGNILRKGESGMGSIGVFGHSLADEAEGIESDTLAEGRNRLGAVRKSRSLFSLRSKESADFAIEEAAPGAPLALAFADGASAGEDDAFGGGGGAGGKTAPEVQPVIRSNFADIAFWAATLNTDKDGTAEIKLDMPENLTTWKIRTWAMGHGTRVGQGEAEVITSKDLIIRLQAPRFFVEKDEVTLSANVHNYLENAKQVRTVLELEGGALKALKGSPLSQSVMIPGGGEKRINWRVKAVAEGEAKITMKALTDEESDAMQMSYPVLVHGMLKTESFSGALRPKDKTASLKLTVPAERRAEQTRLEVRYSPSLATAMVDALPYLAAYPYGCTEQTLNRFVPTVITQKILIDMGIDLKAIRKKRTNLNAQEIGDDKERAKQWQRLDTNPVFNDKKVDKMVKAGVERLTSMQNADGGWGWFHARGGHSYAHTTAVVIHGLQLARQNDVAIVPGVLEKGIQWLKRYQDEQVTRIKNWAKKKKPGKAHADNLDAFVFMVLCDADKVDAQMRDFLYRDRNQLAVYAKAMLGLSMHKIGKVKERDMLIRNIEQFLVTDDENQSAYLELGNKGYWWYWYGSEFEAQAYYLKLLCVAKPKSKQASGLVKYLINNRKHATYWSNTRDTAICIEAIADYIRATGEDEPDMTVEILLDGKKVKEVEINKKNLFSFDNKLVLLGDAVDTGEHTVEFRKKGKGPLYFNAYLTNFTLEDFITKAGLEVKVERRYYKLSPEEKTIKNVGARGQALDQKVEKFKRELLASGATLKSGDLVEIELIIESKNDYEYLMFEDMKAAGFEPVELRSGYSNNGMGAYMELRDQKVTFFVRSLARGKHSLSYRMRAETPGKFSALPTRGEAMYAPELKANSDEIKISIAD